MKILEGIRVFELAVYAQAPLAGAMLGDLGAYVIKVEHPKTGDLVRGTVNQWGSERRIEVDGKPFHLDVDMMNRSKRGITLDVSTKKGNEAAFRLLKHCDVFLSNLRRKSVEDVWGFTYERLREVNPRIIRLLTNGVGPEGPDAAQPAFDPVGMARSGFMFAGSPPGTPPVYPVGGLSDVHAAEINVIAILGALLARERFGFGQDIATSQVGGMLWLQQFNLYTTLVTGKPYVKFSRYESPAPLNQEFLCGDGHWIFLGVFQPRYWAPLCRAVGRPELIDDPRFATEEARASRPRELVEMFERIFRRQPRDHWVKVLGEVEVISAPIYQMDEAAKDAHASLNGYIRDVDHPVLGKIKTPGFPIRFSETPVELEKVAPQLGQHTDQVLGEIGYGPDEIAAMRQEGVI